MNFWLILFNFSIPNIEDEILTTQKKRKFWSSSKIGDMTHEDFCTPRKAKRNFCGFKNTVNWLSYANKLLNQKNKRLLKKVETLNDIISRLEEKSFLNESSANVIKVNKKLFILNQLNRVKK